MSVLWLGNWQAMVRTDFSLWNVAFKDSLAMHSMSATEKRKMFLIMYLASIYTVLGSVKAALEKSSRHDNYGQTLH